MNVAEVAPEFTVTLFGTVAAAVLLLDNVTVLCVVLPATGAFNVTVAIEFADPPTTLIGFSVTDATPGGGTTVRTPLCVDPLSVAEMFAVTGADTV